jgi:hypothetical protein
MKKIEVQMLLYKLTKQFIKVQGNMLNAFGIILFYKVMWWFDGQDIWHGTKETKVQSHLSTYIMWIIYICIYTLYMCVNV